MTKTEASPASARITRPPIMRVTGHEWRAHGGTAR
jgi:hypothetical protein